MDKTIKIALIIISLVIAAACSTILGPPGSENEFPVVPPSSSLPSDQLIEGQPNLKLINISGGYYIWKDGSVCKNGKLCMQGNSCKDGVSCIDGNSWHIRVSRLEGPPTSFSVRPFFSGVIQVDNGVIRDVDRTKISPPGQVHYTLRELNYRIEPMSEIEAFDFTVRPLGNRYCITLDLRVNGGITPKLVHIGRSMYVVDTLPITMCVQ